MKKISLSVFALLLFQNAQAVDFNTWEYLYSKSSVNLAEKDNLNDKCISDCGTNTPVHRKVYSRDMYKMNLSSEDEAFIGSAVRALPKENVTESRLDVEFSTFVGGGRTLDVEDKKCFAAQIKALKDIKEDIKNSPYPIKFGPIEYTVGSNRAIATPSSFAITSNQGTSLFVGATYNDDTQKCSYITSEKILEAINESIEKFEINLSSKKNIKSENDKILQDLLSSDDNCEKLKG